MAQRGPGSNGKELHFPKSYRTRTSVYDELILYQDASCRGESYPTAEMQLASSIAPADWNVKICDRKT